MIDDVLQRWIAALVSRGDAAATVAVVARDGVVHRLGWSENAGKVVESFHGPEEVARWLARSPAGIAFESMGEPEQDDELWRCRYKVGLQDFVNMGTWRLCVDEEGLITELWHEPDPLAPPELPQR